MSMKQFLTGLFLSVMLLPARIAAPLSSNARTVVPSAVQQIISVDYRALRDSPTARALKDRVLPDNLKQFETALKGAGIDPDKDVEQLTFVSYRPAKGGLRSIGIAQGPFKQKEFLQKMRLKKIKPEKYLLSYLYPWARACSWCSSIPAPSVRRECCHQGRDRRARQRRRVAGIEQHHRRPDHQRGQLADLERARSAGTQNMMRSALGQAASLGDYDVVKKRLLASDYTMNFTNGVTFDLNVKTSDTMTAATMASLLKAGVLYRKMNATPTEKLALDNTTVDNSHDMLQMHFKTDDQRFTALLKSDLFAAVSK